LDAEHDGRCEHADGDEREPKWLADHVQRNRYRWSGDAVGDYDAAGGGRQWSDFGDTTVGGDPGSVRELGEHRQQHPGDDGDSKRHRWDIGRNPYADGVEWSSGLQRSDLGWHGGTELCPAFYSVPDAHGSELRQCDGEFRDCDDDRVEWGKLAECDGGHSGDDGSVGEGDRCAR